MGAPEMLSLPQKECGPCQNGEHERCVSVSGEPCSCQEILEDMLPCSQLLPEGVESLDPTLPALDADEGLLDSSLVPEPIKPSVFVGSGIRAPERKNKLKVLTSIAENKLLRGVTFETYNSLFWNGPCTAQELSAKLRPGVHKRLPELERKEVVRRIGRKKCAVTGRHADLWDVTDQLPQPPSKGLVKTHLLLAVGQTVPDAIKNFAEPVGWKVKELVDMPPNPRYHWMRKIVMENGESFEAAGQRVPGGYVMTLWR